MDYKRYTLEEKIKFLDALEKKGTVASAARSMGIHDDDVCYRWARKKDELRAAYALSCNPDRPVKQVRRRGGMSIHRASVEFNKNLASVQSWYRSKEELLALYYSQQKASLEKESSPPDTVWEVQMTKEKADEHLVRQCKALAKENEYLKDRVMFLEKLNEILKQRGGPVKKKSSSPQSGCALSKEDE
jgi:transposase